MSKTFNLYFSENEHDLLDQSKQLFGSRLSSILKDHLRTLLRDPADGKKPAGTGQPAEETKRIAALYAQHFGDIKNEREFLTVFEGNTAAAAQALSNRKRRLKTANPELADAVCLLLSKTCPTLSPAPPAGHQTGNPNHEPNTNTP